MFRNAPARSFLVLCLAAAGILATGRPHAARAEIAVGESVSWMVADADLVVRGAVSGVRSKTGRGSVVWDTVTVKVRRRFKGRCGESLTFVVRHLRDKSLQKAWRRNQDGLYFLVHGKRYASYDKGYQGVKWALRNEGNRPSFIRLGKQLDFAAFTVDFRKLKSADSVLAAVQRAASQAQPQRPARHRLEVAFDSEAYKSLWSGSTVYLNVAADTQLERHAQAWLNSKSGEARARGAAALVHFQSQANIDRLAELLQDTGYQITSMGGNSAKRRVYFVRRAAWETLRKWKVGVKAPVFEEPFE